MSETYEVIAGNIGTVYTGTCWEDAVSVFHVYRAKSQNGEDRGAHEDVTMMQDGEPSREYFAPRCDSCGEYLAGEAPRVMQAPDGGLYVCSGCYVPAVDGAV